MSTSLVPVRLPKHGTYDVSRHCSAIRNAVRVNQERSAHFKSPQAQSRRARWLRTHRFRPKSRICIDGRASDFAKRLGYEEGIMEMARSGGCMDHMLDSWICARRTRDDNRKYRVMRIGDSEVMPMSELGIFAAHWSKAYPDTHSCAAWGHKTDNAVAEMGVKADQLNRVLRGWVVAIHVLLDTDTDTVRVYGPRGSINTADYVDDFVNDDEALYAKILGDVQEAYPSSWEPLASLITPGHADAFHPEITEAFVANVHSHRAIRASGRPVELLDHQERLVYVGRPLEMEDPELAKQFFLVEDMGAWVNAHNCAIGMTYVTCNVIRDALANRNHDWKVPLIVSIPHDPEDDDHAITQEYARGIWHGGNKNNPGLKLWLKENKIVIGDKIRARLKQEGLTDLPQSYLSGIENIVERTDCLVTVHDRRDRLWIPCE
jgi:hypothetical protein